MNIHRFLILLSLTFGLAFTGAAFAEGVPHTFSSGTPAKAEEVNANFDALISMINELKAENESLKTRIETLEDSPVQEMAQFLEVHPNPSQMPLDTGTQGPLIRFKEVNVQIVNGTGITSSSIDPPNGLGNLVVGYDKRRSGDSQKTGSHNLIIGDAHNYTSHAGLVAGYLNTISGLSASVSGGSNNEATSTQSSVSGGWNNKATSHTSSVSGGWMNIASGPRSSVSGGLQNEAVGENSSILGGTKNILDGTNATSP